jgi:mannose-6-phosphate isomerase-like protein (cupin superfamily)
MLDRTRKLLIAGLFSCAACVPAAERQVHASQSVTPAATPLVLQPEDGELRLRRPPPAVLTNLTVPFVIKVDPASRNGGAQDFYVLTEEVPVGASIPPHLHPHSEELVFIHKGRGTAWLNGKEAKLQPGTIIFMPRYTGVKLTNDGTEPISLMAIFSRPGFEQYHRAVSVAAGETPTPLTREELNAIRARHGDVVVYEQK